jgi:hypothetical protein
MLFELGEFNVIEASIPTQITHHPDTEPRTKFLLLDRKPRDAKIFYYYLNLDEYVL